jgi:hypothetical protein
MNQLWQFGSKSEEEINAEIEENVSNNTKKTREFIWKQFSRLGSLVVLQIQFPRVGIFQGWQKTCFFYLKQNIQFFLF